MYIRELRPSFSTLSVRLHGMAGMATTLNLHTEIDAPDTLSAQKLSVLNAPEALLLVPCDDRLCVLCVMVPLAVCHESFAGRVQPIASFVKTRTLAKGIKSCQIIFVVV